MTTRVEPSISDKLRRLLHLPKRTVKPEPSRNSQKKVIGKTTRCHDTRAIPKTAKNGLFHLSRESAF